MPLSDLLPELLRLTPEEMVQAIEILQIEVNCLPPPAPSEPEFEFAASEGALDTARQLLDMLQEKVAAQG